ncbi:hypothetical protein EG68_04971 [Paragonimus skrjabini miyazakii]|uniref:Uncharacterized protein n=1 Tax=Paragonimus skrjabini miyazakii TaxID=59628 RepID=A0A8S9YXA9_9TREM|nr:hypothetical protein EG68_04971 [Paragonimus skrjabini miyazakii]
MEIQIPFGDLEKFVPLCGQSYPPNPYYTTADYYYPMQQITDGTEADGIIVAVDKQRNLKIFLDNVTHHFRILEQIPYGLWFNLGIVYRQLPESPIEAYFNGKYVQVSEVSKGPIWRGVNVGVDECWIRLGDSHFRHSLTNVSMNDLVIWLRSLEEFESHRFLGYTRELTVSNMIFTFYSFLDEIVIND